MDHLSVADNIKALALINIEDIFRFVLSAKDSEIEERYVTEERAIDVAEKYLEIALKAQMLEHSIKGWSMEYSQPIKGSEERMKHKAYFYTERGEATTDDTLRDA